MPIHVFKFVLAAVVIVGAVIASKRVRSSHSNWASRQLALVFNQPGPCFAAARGFLSNPIQGLQEGPSSPLPRVTVPRFLQSRIRVTPEEREQQPASEAPQDYQLQRWRICRAEACVTLVQDHLSELSNKSSVS